MEIIDRNDKKRKLDHIDGSVGVLLDTLDHLEVGWNTLQPILENDVLRAKIPTAEMAFSLLVRWFRIISRDQEKLRVFRQWVITSSDNVKLDIDDEREECNIKTTSPSSSSSSASSSTSLMLADSNNKKALAIDTLLHEEKRLRLSNFVSAVSVTPVESNSFNLAYTNSTGSSSNNGTHHQVLLQQLLQQQQQQIVLLQQLQQQTPSQSHQGNIQPPPPAPVTVTLNPKSGGAGSVLTVTMKGGRWHQYSGRCECTAVFMAVDGSSASVRRVAGGGEGELRFITPSLSSSSNGSPHVPAVVHLKLCSGSDVPIVCLEPFLYTPPPVKNPLACSHTSDEDSEEMAEDAAIDEDEHDEDEGTPPPRALTPLETPMSTGGPTPRQLMTIRERMMEQIQKGSRGPARLALLQQPSVRVVWKNRRLDVPFKLRVECLEDTGGSAFSALTPAKLVALAIVADHKGRLQIDAAENYVEDFSSQGVAHFANLRMTKGTWGKEWSITFAAVLKSSLNNPVVVAVSPSCSIVVKTRKNPQVRNNARDSGSPPSPVPHVERKSTDTARPKRGHRVEDLLDHRPASPPPRAATARSHSEDMASLLYAAELKQQEEQQQEEPASSPASTALMPVCQNSQIQEPELTFANFQSLVNYLEDIRAKRLISASIIEQPQPKRDSKVLIVKKGKPFRVPFKVQFRSTVQRHNPQYYVCVAVLRNDKGEEVAVRNSEVPYDSRGVACFAGLMVMKGTWGKAVQLTFETRWATRRMGQTQNPAPPPWGTVRMLVVAETAPVQLMCYTKDKKTSPSSIP